jgi:hypothetical protein
MTSRIHAGAWLCTFATVGLGLAARAQGNPDIILFDEDDSIGVGYYDASVGNVTLPSVLVRGGPGDKLIINSGQAYTGSDSGLLDWRSAVGGSWRFFIARPGWSMVNVAGYSNLVVYLNGPASVAAANLPQIGLESSPPDLSTPAVPLGDYLPGGMDQDPLTWDAAVVPLTAFPAAGGFSLTKVKAVYFAQGAADDATHTIWFDNVRFRTGSGSNPPPPPVAPQGVVTRGGDHSVTLHWNPNTEAGLAGYNVFRSTTAGGAYTKLTSKPAPIHTYADLTAINGQTNFYRVTAIDSYQQESAVSGTVSGWALAFASDDDFLEYVQRCAFDYFWYQANPTNGLVRDRSDPTSAASVAATGFGLTAIGVAIDHGWITRAEGRARTLATLKTFQDAPQGDGVTGTIGYHGWFYHFLDVNTGFRAGTSELSSIDTALLLAGVLYAREYFHGAEAEETGIRDLADAILSRIDWVWMQNGGGTLTMGWRPESGFLGARWVGYNEAMILYLLGMGAPSNPLPATCWANWTGGYQWNTSYELSFVHFPPLFGHQYSHCWVDFRHIADAYMQGQTSTYFENSRRATLAQQAYAIENPKGHTGYGTNVWGFTACDGPGIGGYFPYIARGAPPEENDDGTVAPTAAGGSMPFAPEICVPALRGFYTNYLAKIWTGYGFRDAFNLETNWWGPHVLGIDQGPILLMIENHRSGRVWDVFMRNPTIQHGLERAGFVQLPFLSPSLAPQNNATSFRLSWPANLGRQYQVEYGPDLFRWLTSPTGWIVAEGAVASWDDAGPPATDVPPGSASGRFYRVFRLGTP